MGPADPLREEDGRHSGNEQYAIEKKRHKSKNHDRGKQNRKTETDNYKWMSIRIAFIVPC
jgi:hypothetical protein